MATEPSERIALAVPPSLKLRVEEWRRRQATIPSWTGAARYLLGVALDIEDQKAAKAKARAEKKAKV